MQVIAEQKPKTNPVTSAGRVYLSVVVPAYNEEDRISKTLDSINKYLQKQDFNSEIIVVSGSSTDKTVESVRMKMTEIPNLSVIDQKKNNGKGGAVAEGMLASVGEIRLFTDADNSTDISHFDKMKPLFESGYDVVICSRDAKDAPGARQAVSQPWYKRILGNAGNIFIQIVAVHGFWDTQCGFKAFRDYTAEKIFPIQRIPGWGFDVEVLALSKKFGYKIGVVPAYWVNDPKSHVRLSTYFQVLFETVKVRFNLISGKYNAR